MIRVLIVILLLFVVWVLFLSDFNKQKKIIIAVLAAVVFVIAIWLDGYGEKPAEGIVSKQDLRSCGLKLEHSYRSNYDVDLCLRNTAERGTVKRLRFAIIASDCAEQDSCKELQRVEREVLFVVAPSKSATLKDNLSFSQVDPARERISWSVEVLNIKAVK